MNADPEESTDGRRARSERSRMALVDAMLDLVMDGLAPPTAEMIAERAAVSPASLFRHFSTLEELQEQTNRRFLDRYRDLFQIPGIGTGSLEDRIDRYVSMHVGLYETTGQALRFVRTQAFHQSHAFANVQRLRESHLERTRLHFAPELRRLSRASKEDVTTEIVMITSSEAWDLLRDLGRSRTQIRRTWKTTLTAVLTARHS